MPPSFWTSWVSPSPRSASMSIRTSSLAVCVSESILKTQQGQDIRIVLVDNGSGNGSEESLREEFAGEKECM